MVEMDSIVDLIFAVMNVSTQFLIQFTRCPISIFIRSPSDILVRFNDGLFLHRRAILHTTGNISEVEFKLTVIIIHA